MGGGAQTFYPNDKTFYVNPQHQQNNQTNYTNRNFNFDASITKQDFPDIKTRGRVLENRIDIDLEKNGNILWQGRDEKYVMQLKREQEQLAMKEALQKQIDEKQRKKDMEKMRRKQEEMDDDVRVKEEMRALAIAEGVQPLEAYGNAGPAGPGAPPGVPARA